MKKILALALLALALPLTAQSPGSGLGFFPVSDISQCTPFPPPEITFCPTPKGMATNTQAQPNVFSLGSGSPGPQGPTGPQGPQGIQGPQGPAGATFSGGTCHWAPTGVVDAQGIVVKISCP